MLISGSSCTRDNTAPTTGFHATTATAVSNDMARIGRKQARLQCRRTDWLEEAQQAASQHCLSVSDFVDETLQIANRLR